MMLYYSSFYYYIYIFCYFHFSYNYFWLSLLQSSTFSSSPPQSPFTAKPDSSSNPISVYLHRAQSQKHARTQPNALTGACIPPSNAFAAEPADRARNPSLREGNLAFAVSRALTYINFRLKRSWWSRLISASSLTSGETSIIGI